MVTALLYCRRGYLVGEPDVPKAPFPHVVVWGNEMFLAGDPAEDGRPRYYLCVHYVIPETRELPCI